MKRPLTIAAVVDGAGLGRHGCGLSVVAGDDSQSLEHPGAAGSVFTQVVWGVHPAGRHVLMLGLALVLPRISPKHFEVDTFKSTYWMVMLLVLALMGYMHVMTLWAGVNGRIDMAPGSVRRHLRVSRGDWKLLEQSAAELLDGGAHAVDLGQRSRVERHASPGRQDVRDCRRGGVLVTLLPLPRVCGWGLAAGSSFWEP